MTLPANDTTASTSPGQIALQSWADESGIPKPLLDTLLNRLFLHEVSSSVLPSLVCERCECNCVAGDLYLMKENVNKRVAKLESAIIEQNECLGELIDRAKATTINLDKYNIFPIETLEELQEYTEVMTKKTDFKKYLIHTFKLKGKKLWTKERLLRYCFTDKLARNFNLTGTDNKLNLLDQPIIKLMLECWNSDVDSIEEHMIVLKTYFDNLRTRACYQMKWQS